MTNNGSPGGIEIENLPLGVLLKNLSVGSWAWLIGIPVGAFLLGYQAPGVLGITKPYESFQEEQNKREAAEQKAGRFETDLKTARETIKTITEEKTGLETTIDEGNGQIADQVSKIETLTGNLKDQSALLQTCISERNTATDQQATFKERLDACSNRLRNITVALWYVHQGDGRGYPEGNNSDVHNHDDRPNWNSRRFKNERCLTHGGPRIDEKYATNICREKTAVGPLGVLAVGGGTCGHGVYVIGCVK